MEDYKTAIIELINECTDNQKLMVLYVFIARFMDNAGALKE